MGKFLSEHVHATWRKVGTFTIVKNGRSTAKVGGNVAAYFCTPDLEVVHAAAGNMSAADFLDQARWARDLWNSIRGLPSSLARTLSAVAHARDKGHAVAVGGNQPVLGCRVVHDMRPEWGTVTTLDWNPRVVTASDWTGVFATPGFHVHEWLASHPLADLQDAVRVVFERILGEKISDAEVRIVEARRRGCVR